MKAHKKKKPKIPEKETIDRTKFNKPDRPWVLQYKWNSIEDFKTYSWFKKMEEGWRGDWREFLSVEHAQEQIAKRIRSHLKGRLFLGRSWRIINASTKEIISMDEFIKSKSK